MAIRDGIVITPTVTDSILESVTRATLIELFERELGMKVKQREIDRTELYVCQEVFLCGSGYEVMPIIILMATASVMAQLGKTPRPSLMPTIR
ncbi:MAG: hypothetical protein CM1200mP41_16020 [Gammaproteobacteria bacterium]|nr:MAG: hypothetical protein CM1200mP41_16020 [Gammaproteobacteria bacterium]